MLGKDKPTALMINSSSGEFSKLAQVYVISTEHTALNLDIISFCLVSCVCVCVDGRREPHLLRLGPLWSESGQAGGKVSCAVPKQRRAVVPVRSPDNYLVLHEDQDTEGTTGIASLQQHRSKKHVTCCPSWFRDKKYNPVMDISYMGYVMSQIEN